MAVEIVITLEEIHIDQRHGVGLAVASRRRLGELQLHGHGAAVADAHQRVLIGQGQQLAVARFQFRLAFQQGQVSVQHVALGDHPQQQTVVVDDRQVAQLLATDQRQRLVERSGHVYADRIDGHDIGHRAGGQHLLGDRHGKQRQHIAFGENPHRLAGIDHQQPGAGFLAHHHQGVRQRHQGGDADDLPGHQLSDTHLFTGRHRCPPPRD